MHEDSSLCNKSSLVQIRFSSRQEIYWSLIPNNWKDQSKNNTSGWKWMRAQWLFKSGGAWSSNVGGTGMYIIQEIMQLKRFNQHGSTRNLREL